MGEFNNQSILYLDNFRGFEDTFIPLKKVNFLMGENSTGKTSVMSLINLLHHPSFWLSREFFNSDINFGSFSEIADKGRGKNYFRIGFLNSKIIPDKITPNKNERTTNFLLLTFYDDKGKPSILEYSYTKGNITTLAKVAKNNKGIQYKVLVNDLGKSIESPDLMSAFRQWIDFVSLEIKKVNFSKISFEGLPPYLPFIQSIIESNLMEKESKKEDKTFLRGSSSTDFFDDFNFDRSFGWIAPIRAKPRRVYDNFNYSISPEGEHAPYVLKSLLSSKKSKDRSKEFMETFGAHSGLFDSVNINSFDKSNLSPFEVNIVLNSHLFKIHNVGYGVSQVLPIVVDIFGRRENTLFAIQQPEVHLHPKAQAALGELIYKISCEENKNFLIETHSEYLVNRFRYNLHKNKDKKETVDSQILFFERNENGNRVHTIAIESDGKYSENQPKSFNEFFIDEELNLLEI